MAVVEEGAAPGVILFDSDGNILSSGTTLSGTTITDGGSMIVADQGTADTTTVSSGGKMYVSSGGVATSTTVNPDGSMYISNGGVANRVLLDNYAGLSIESGGTASIVYNPFFYGDIDSEDGAIVEYVDHAAIYFGRNTSEGNTELVSKSNETLENHTINASHIVAVAGNGIANNTVVEGGFLKVLSGGVANNTEMYYSAGLNITGGTANGVTMKEFCSISVSDGGVLNNLVTDKNGCAIWVENGTVNQAVLLGNDEDDAGLILASGGAANNTAVHYEGELYVSSGGVASNTEITSGGEMIVYSGGVHRGSMQIESGAFVSAYRGAKIDFSLADKTAGNDYLINDLSLIRGTPTYTITISADQADGCYKLAQGADSFTGTITIGTETESYGTLTVNDSALIYNGKQYSLTLNGENLQLFISPPDSEAPVLEITGNATAWTNKNVVLTAVASDSPSGISSVEYSLDNINWMEGESVSVSKNGTVYFRATDKAGNVTVKNVIVDKIDKTAPVRGKITLKQTDQNNVKVTISGFTDNVKLARYDVYLNGKKVGSTTGTTYTYKSSANLTAGTSTFAVKAVDSVGNVSATASAKLTVNLAVVGKATSKSTVLTWKAASVSGGRKQYEVVVSGKKYISTTNKITIKGLAVGSRTVTVYARSKTNKLTTLDSGDIIKVTDGTAPTGGKVVAAQSGQKNIKVTISGFKDNVKVTKYYVYVNGKKVATTTSTSYTYKSSVNLIGKKTVMVKALDAAGNVSAGKSVAITIKDVTAPSKVTGLKVSGTPTQSSAKLVWTKGVDNVGVTKYTVKVSGVSKTYTTTTNSLVVKGLTAGKHTYQVYAYDATGRKSVVSTAYSFNVKDITKPTGGKVVAAQSGQKGIKLTISGFKDNVKVTKYYVYVNGKKVATTTSTSYIYKSSVNLIGKKTVMVKALDAAGNVSAGKSVAITIKDVTAPSKVTGLKVSGTPTQSSAKLVWTKGVDNVGVTKYTVKVSGVSKTYTTTTNSLVVKGLTAGKHTYQVYAYDATGRKSVVSTAYSFNVKDITKPTGGKITLKQASQNSVKITISSFKDNVKVAKYYVYVNGTKVATTTSTTYTYTQSANFTTSKLTFAVKAVDSTGNVSASKSAAFAAKVRVSGKATNLSTVLTWTKPSISGTLKRYEITVGGKKYTSTTNKITIKGLAVGTNSVTIKAVNTKNQYKTVCSGELIKVVSGAISKTITGLDNKTFNSVTRDDYFLTDEEVVGFYNSLPTAAKGGYTTGTAGNDTVTFAANKSCVVTGMSLGAGNDKIVMTDSAEKYLSAASDYPAVIGTEIAVLRFASDAKTGIIDMGAGDDSLYLGKNVNLHAEMIMSNDGFLRMGTGNDKITLGAGAVLECLDVDLGAGNDTVLLGAGSCMDSNLVNLGDGDDTVRVGKDAELGVEVFFGAGNDKLIIDQGAFLNPWFEEIDNPLDFGAGTDTLVLNGSVMLTDYNRIAGLEKLEGTGTFLINEFDGYDKAQVEGLLQQGFNVINTEDGYSCVRDRQTELADNLRSGAKEIACYSDPASAWENFWLCGKEKAASLYQGFCDDTDWFKFTMDRAYEGTLEVGLEGINAELYDSDGTKICDVTDEGIELSTFTVGATYYLKATISASDVIGFGSITFASK